MWKALAALVVAPRNLLWTYVFSNLNYNLWLIVGKISEARSRLYRSRILQVNRRLKPLDEIYKLETLLHHSAFKISAKSRWTTSHFHRFIFKMSLIVSTKLSKIHELWWKFFRNSAFFVEKRKICYILKYPEISQRKLSDFSENDFPKVKKRFSKR